MKFGALCYLECKLKTILPGLLASYFLMYGGVSLAVEDTCEPEPTDQTLRYGDYVICTTYPALESDYYRVYLQEGDKFRIEATQLTGSFSIFLKVIAPDGTEVLDWLERDTTAVFESSASTTGLYTAIVTNNYNRGNQYSFSLSCLGGPCLTDVIDPPEISTGGGITIGKGFVDLDITNGLHPDTSYCKDDHHYGRLVVDEVNSILYICTQAGWDIH
ncbi:hypothetical protein ThidrDRAFT_1351 [Thiorhodococcus drewsii AZ1]|uniref:Peptidase domain protein n=1 Tax=Thiorhodococcus drewsii AZ1 TaxID=765913 RepID=G2DYZ2_9GAMM|nr:hypothetical protein [Thiorhodococcus drewsii]EGV32501.1 hypothetical protein ThidrDRAFT_1351 [Thiorhodococcus drewsii AZ1]